MSFYKIPLKAGQPQKQNIAGSLLLIDNLGAAPGVDVTLTRIGGSDGVTMPNRVAGFRLVEPYEGVTFNSAVDTVLLVFLSDSDVQLGLTNGGAVAVPGGVQITNPIGAPVPVSIATPVTLNATAVQINNTPAQAVPVTLHGSDDATPIPIQKAPLSTFVDIAPVSVGVAAVALISDPTLKRITIRNSHASATVAIGGAGVTLANGARVLGPGDMWVDEDAAGAAWFGISDTAATMVQIGGVK